jgi:hypothetical protein
MIIEICLPGKPRTTVEDIGDYRITVERLDGVACTEIEARTAMAAYAIQRAGGKRLNKNQKKPKKTKENQRAARGRGCDCFFRITRSSIESH